jgi:hypothetical protein
VSKWQVRKSVTFGWVVANSDITSVKVFSTWSEAMDYANETAWELYLTKQWVRAVADSLGTERGVRREGWRS